MQEGDEVHRKILSIFVLAITLISILSTTTGTEVFMENSEKSNYTSGHGNISYPAITQKTKENAFSRSILIGDVNGDGKKEIIAVSTINSGVYSYITDASEMDNTLYVYSSNLSLLWKFRDKNAEEQTEYPTFKTSSLALGDLDGDGVDDIVFSISPSIAPIDTVSGEYYPKTTLYAFKGDGTLLWNRTFEGGITPESLIIDDINGDGKNEILVGSDNLYMLDSSGEVISTYFLDKYTYRGISEIISHQNDIVFSFWHYNETKRAVRDYFRVANALFTITKISYYNGSFTSIWSTQIEDQDSLISMKHYRMFSDAEFKRVFVLRINPSAIVSMDLDTGVFVWNLSVERINTAYGLSIYKNGILLFSENSLCFITKEGDVIKNISLLADIGIRPTICVFDVDGDNTDEAILLYKEGILSFSPDNGQKEWDIKLWEEPKEGYLFAVPVILHSDTDNDGFDEIITTDPEGRIVIIDSGTPPSTEEPETSTNNLMFTGIGAGAIVISVAAVWIWRKRRDEN